MEEAGQQNDYLKVETWMLVKVELMPYEFGGCEGMKL